jgi:hypothetical protein
MFSAVLSLLFKKLNDAKILASIGVVLEIVLRHVQGS